MTDAPSVAPTAWPRFEGALCGALTDRERMGQPDRYVAGRLDAALLHAHRALRSATVDELLETLANGQSGLARRLASGNLLAWLDDPRIRPWDPAMCDIPGGEIEIGLPFEEVHAVLDRFRGLGLDRSWIEKECPRHRVRLQPFRMARYPVTNAEYREFLLDSGHPELPTGWSFRQFPQERANHPVFTVSAASADAYTLWLARRTGRGFRLPSEAEWEWAAAGPQTREFPWGERFDAELANTGETGLFSTSPVGAFVGGESVFGLSDIAGNVEEYVADDYAAYPGGPFIADNLVQFHGAYRVARGGSFARWRDLARTRRRHGQNPRSATYAMGFRLAETP
jgi:formylglycine-generating enzyme required for sulfatase activity